MNHRGSVPCAMATGSTCRSTATIPVQHPGRQRERANQASREPERLAELRTAWEAGTRACLPSPDDATVTWATRPRTSAALSAGSGLPQPTTKTSAPRAGVSSSSSAYLECPGRKLRYQSGWSRFTCACTAAIEFRIGGATDRFAAFTLISLARSSSFNGCHDGARRDGETLAKMAPRRRRGSALRSDSSPSSRGDASRNGCRSAGPASLRYPISQRDAARPHPSQPHQHSGRTIRRRPADAALSALLTKLRGVRARTP